MDFKKEYLNKITHTVRASQAVLQYGVGAMVDFPSQTLMTAAPKYWVSSVEKIHDERLEKVLGVSYFGVPGDKDTYTDGISYVRFPEWYFCTKCRRFMPISKWIEEYKRFSPQNAEKDPNMVKNVNCPKCRTELAVARIVSVCENGHISDFPWVKWVHAQSFGGPRRVCGFPKLRFNTGATTAEGLESLTITCDGCRAKANLEGALSPDVFEKLENKTNGEYNFRCCGYHPWKHSKERCTSYPVAKQRGSSSVYFPFTESSLVIPPYSSRITNMIESSTAYEECRTVIVNIKKTVPDNSPEELLNLMIANQIEMQSEKISNETGINKEEVIDVLNRKWVDKTEEKYNTAAVKYRAEEYKALNGELKSNDDNSGEFIREGTDNSEYAIPFVKSVSLIHKLREVQALVGFTRCRPLERTASPDDNGILVSIKDEKDDWYPAYEVRGEGIFLEFDGEDIKAFCYNSTELQKRADTINNNYRESYIGQNNPRTITAKFLLLHTLSHLLIKQLSFECGYNIASLKERIYCSDLSDGIEMQGILIYTASGDSEGTMGGLVRQGRPDVFPALYRKAVESARFCSNDPVCSLSGGQGRDSLNLAACYSCTLIPETSCEEFNVFLDRGTVVGTFGNKDMGLYSKQLYDNASWTANKEYAITDEVSRESVHLYGSAIVSRDGTDLEESPFEEIFTSLISDTDDANEKKFLSEVLSNIEKFKNKEKPYEGSVVLKDGTEYSTDLLWKKSKTIYFSSAYCEEYSALKESDWNCFCGADESVDVHEFIEAIRGK